MAIYLFILWSFLRRPSTTTLKERLLIPFFFPAPSLLHTIYHPPTTIINLSPPNPSGESKHHDGEDTLVLLTTATPGPRRGPSTQQKHEKGCESN